MGAAFQGGSLPGFAPMPEGQPQQKAAALADAISIRDENSTAALATAFKAAGYGIRDANGDVDFNTTGWQGIALDGWEIAAVAKLYGDGGRIGLGRFGDSFSELSPNWKKETNTTAIINGIRSGLYSTDPSIQIWANLIVELGLRADVPYDLRIDEDTRHAQLDAIQITLIMTRLIADLNYRSKRPQHPITATETYQKARERGVVRMIGASFKSETGAPIRTDDSPPCNLGELDQLILDINATGMGIVFGEFVGYLENKEIISKVPGQVLGAANAALILLKLVMTFAAVEADITLDAEMLTRTKTTQDGERRLLSATVRLDVGKWQVVNCIRPALNRAGIDFSLPSDGLLAGVRVDWNLLQGGRTRENIRAARTGANVPSDQIVYLDWQSTAQPDDKGKYYTYTDDKGVTRTNVVGFRQPKDLSRMNLRPIIKPIAVDLDIQVKTMKIKDKTGAAGTANDLAGNALAFWNGDALGGIAGTAAETLYRKNFGWSKVQTFPVKDWVPCDGGWRGSITYRRTLYNRSLVERRKGSIYDLKYLSISRESDLYEGIINVSPGETPAIVNGNGRVSYRKTSFDFQRADRDTSCGPHRSIRVWQEGTVNQIETASGNGDSDLGIFVGGDGLATINFQLPNAAGEFTSSSVTNFGGGCMHRDPTRVNRRSPIKIDGARYTIDHAPLDRLNPHILRGTRTIPGRDGTGLVVMWDLSRCS